MITNMADDIKAAGRARREVFRSVRWPLRAYLVISILTVVALALLSKSAPGLVNSDAWGRGIIIAVVSVVTYRIALSAVRGSRGSLVRLRVVVLAQLVAICGVLIFLPLPGWMVVEQLACGALLLITAAFIFRRARA